jgi:hypothetical protein
MHVKARYRFYIRNVDLETGLIDSVGGLKWKPVYKSKLRMWLALALWLTGAAICGVIDHMRQSTLLLSVYFPLAAIIVVVATRKHRSPNYKFEFVKPGVVRSSLGFEVRASKSCLEYVEGNHVISWRPATPSGSIGRFDLSEQGIRGWDAPFVTEPMGSKKKKDIATAVRSALIYLQLVEGGKIRPKRDN